ncbi:MAG: T9SS type A sorting domain-containing protein [Chitinophagales bacterium]
MKRIFTTILCLGITLAYGQSIERQVVSSYGAYAETGGLSLSSTVGEVATSTLTGADIILTQGFQQPAPEELNVGIERVVQNMNITAYPNPTSQKVILELSSDKELEILIELFDISGRKLNTGSADQLTVLGRSLHEIDLSTYSSGQYIIHLSDRRGTHKESIKVQKID